MYLGCQPNLVILKIFCPCLYLKIDKSDFIVFGYFLGLFDDTNLLRLLRTQGVPFEDFVFRGGNLPSNCGIQWGEGTPFLVYGVLGCWESLTLML